jgi:hypothetical protein
MTLEPATRPWDKAVVVFEAPVNDTSQLEHRVALVPGVTVSIGLAGPVGLRSLEVTTRAWAPETRAVLDALLGDDLVAILTRGPSSKSLTTEWISRDSARPWLRLATAEALNRWLQLPLDQALIDAERGVLRAEAARTLPAGPARDAVFGAGLALSRAAAWRLTDYLESLQEHGRTIPDGLRSALRRLVTGYESMVDDLGARDEELASVVEAGRFLSAPAAGSRPAESRHTAEASHDPLGGWMPVAPRRPHGRATQIRSRVATCVIDPRHVPARVLEFSDEPGIGEIALRRVSLAEFDAVEVEVPLFRSPWDQPADVGATDRLMIRLIDDAGDVRFHALLTLEAGSTGDTTDDKEPVLRGVIPLRGLDITSIRVDVVDISITPATAPGDSDDGLRRARQQASSLARRRRTQAAERLRYAPDEHDRTQQPDDVLAAEIVAAHEVS